MLALNGCSNSKIKIESEIGDECLENHLDTDRLKIETLSDDSKYIKDASLFYSIRERFLNNNSIMSFENIELDNSSFKTLKNNSNYLYLFDNDKIKNHITYFMTVVSTTDVVKENQERKIYEEDKDSVSINLGYVNNGDKKYTLSISSELADSETVEEAFLNNTIDYSKYIYIDKIGNNRFYVIEQYNLSSIEKNDLDKISIDIQLKYNLYKDILTKENYSCDGYEANIILNNDEDSLQGNLIETQFNKLSNLLTEAAKKEKTVKESLEENEELMVELYGEEYQKFIEITKTIEYIKK